METTLDIDEHVMRNLRAEAARRNTSMSELVETALRQLLESAPYAPDLPRLPTFHGGREIADVADQEALQRAFDEG